MERRPDRLPLGIAIMLMSSVLTCTGQLCWKLASSKESVLFLVGGFALYGFGALLMLVAMRFGELSILHPMLSAGYIPVSYTHLHRPALSLLSIQHFLLLLCQHHSASLLHLVFYSLAK